MNHAKRNPGIPKRPNPQKNAKVVLVCGRITNAPKEHESKTGNIVVRCAVKAMLGRESSETWQVVAHNPHVCETIMELGANSHIALSGVPKIELASKHGETVIWRTLFAEKVLSLLREPEGSDE
jgi:hypothetical protein